MQGQRNRALTPTLTLAYNPTLTLTPAHTLALVSGACNAGAA